MPGFILHTKNDMKTPSGRNLVVKDIPRSAVRVLDGLAEAGVATVHEVQGQTGFLGVHMRPIQSGAAIAGNAVTVLSHPGDNIMVHAAVEVCQPEDILVVASTHPSEYAVLGDLLATALMARGVRGAVIDTGVRDVTALRDLGFPVWARHVSPHGTGKETAGWVNVPVTIGDVSIAPGDVICADDDGVVTIPNVRAADCLEAALQRLHLESIKRARLAAGELTLDIDGIRNKLVGMGIEFVDTPQDATE